MDVKKALCHCPCKQTFSLQDILGRCSSQKAGGWFDLGRGMHSLRALTLYIVLRFLGYT